MDSIPGTRAYVRSFISSCISFSFFFFACISTLLVPEVKTSDGSMIMMINKSSFYNEKDYSQVENRLQVR